MEKERKRKKTRIRGSACDGLEARRSWEEKGEKKQEVAETGEVKGV